MDKITNIIIYFISRKISATQTLDQFHLASSTIQQFDYINKFDNQESETFLMLAKNYVLSGRSVSELCEHNSAVAQEYGKPHVSSKIKLRVKSKILVKHSNVPLFHTSSYWYLFIHNDIKSAIIKLKKCIVKVDNSWSVG